MILKLNVDVETLTPPQYLIGENRWLEYRFISNKDLPLGRGDFEMEDEKNAFMFHDSEIKKDDESYYIIIGHCTLMEVKRYGDKIG